MARRAVALTRKQIVDALVSLARELGRPPTNIEFQGRARITHRHIQRHFAKWNDALAAAGLPPNSKISIPNAALLDDWGFTSRKLGHCAQRNEYIAEGKFAGNTLVNRFRSWSGVGRAFFARSETDPKWKDVIQFIRDREACNIGPWLIRPRGSHAKSPGKSGVQSPTHPSTPPDFTYGDPIDFKSLRNAPINEAGVVYLFGCLAHRLGYVVEAIQSNFPDCEAKHKAPDGKLRRVRIEFEFESKNFLLHKHDLAGCDVIVCWRNNWKGCPLHVVDLSVELEKLKNAA